MTTPPIGAAGAASAGDYLLYADSYWLAAKRLFNSRPLPGIAMPGLEAQHLLPGLTLACISIELSLKAVLVLSGFDDARLRTQVGHDLVTALNEAVQLGLFEGVDDEIQSQARSDIAYLNAVYRTPLLKYPHPPRAFAGRPEYLELAQLCIQVSAAKCSVSGLKALTESAFDGPIFGTITHAATSGAGRYRPVIDPQPDGGAE